MRYGELIGRSFEVFRRHRYLWLLGALGGGEALGAGYGGIGNTASGLPGQDGPVLDEVSRWLAATAPLLIGLATLLGIFLIAYFAISCVATGAIIRAAAEHDADRPFARRPAWQAGRRTFLPIVGLRLLILLITSILVLAIGIIVAVGVVSALNDQVSVAAVAFVLAGLAGVVLVPIGAAFGIAGTLGARAIVLEGQGPLAGLGRGFRLLFGRPGRVLLVWLLSVALSLAAGLVTALCVLVVAVPLALVAVGVYAAAGLQALLTAAAILVVLFVVAMLLLSGAVGAYLSVYWTLAFRRLEPDAPLSYAAAC